MNGDSLSQEGAGETVPAGGVPSAGVSGGSLSQERAGETVPAGGDPSAGVSGGSFRRGLGEWVGAAEAYGADGRFAGMGRDTRTVRADDHAGRVTVNVSFEGPFSLSGAYTIADHGSHRTYEGPLNVGFAEVLGDGLVASHNYWPSLGLSQRFFLMVLPGGDHQLSLALLSRGDQLRWTVVGEYRRQAGAAAATRDDPATPPREAGPIDPSQVRDDPTTGRGELLLLRPGQWSGTLHRLGPDLQPSGTVDCSETVAPDAREPPAPSGRSMAVKMSGLGFAPDASFALASDGWTAWTLPGEVAGSAVLSGGRGLSGQFHHDRASCRVWRREVASLDGATKAVLHIWYRGEQRLGAMYGTMTFDPA